jgi:hypothetical protein
MENKKGNRFKDLTNMRFGKLLALEPIKKSYDTKYYWRCICDCGKEKIIMSSNLARGISTTCGCGKIKLGEVTTKHGMTKTRIFKIWTGIRKRCNNPKCKSYKWYGGRGVKISDKWDNFIDFYNDMKEGYADDLSLDRINPNGNYEPGNCRWATSKIQNRNRRNNNVITYNNKSKTLAEWAELSGNNYTVINYRIKNGWDIEKAIFSPTIQKIKSIQSISKYLVF